MQETTLSCDMVFLKKPDVVEEIKINDNEVNTFDNDEVIAMGLTSNILVVSDDDNVSFNKSNDDSEDRSDDGKYKESIIEIRNDLGEKCNWQQSD